VSALAQVFSDAKVVDSRALNRAGAQPLRTILARCLFRLRPGSDDPLAIELERTGVVVWKDFLPEETFAAVSREADDFMLAEVPAWTSHHGTSEVLQFSLASVDAEHFPTLAQWPSDPRVLALASAAERRRSRDGLGWSLLERLTLGDYSEPDPQTILHLDTFHDTHKAWLYLDDVTVENGAFVYVPGSHRLDRVRLWYDYRESIGANEESRRVSDEEIERRGLRRRVFTCRRNTLVMANTTGYHGRSIGEAGRSRRALHMMFRQNPFSLGRWSPARVKSAAMRAKRRFG